MKRCLKCDKEIPAYIKIKNKLKNLCNRKFCLICSPWKKHNTKNLIKENNKCSKCKKEFDKNDYKGQSWCRECNLKQTLERQRIFKVKCVEYSGGKCEKCGYNKCYAALEFHHKDPNEKDFNISKFKCTNFEKNFEEIKKELDKCDLLCSNCHREEHWLDSSVL